MRVITMSQAALLKPTMIQLDVTQQQNRKGQYRY